MKEWWRTLWSRKGGAHKDRRFIMILLVITIIILLFLWAMPKILKKKENLTNLHGRVSSIEYVYKDMDDRIKELEARHEKE